MEYFHSKDFRLFSWHYCCDILVVKLVFFVKCKIQLKVRFIVFFFCKWQLKTLKLRARGIYRLGFSLNTSFRANYLHAWLRSTVKLKRGSAGELIASKRSIILLRKIISIKNHSFLAEIRKHKSNTPVDLSSWIFIVSDVKRFRILLLSLCKC